MKVEVSRPLPRWTRGKESAPNESPRTAPEFLSFVSHEHVLRRGKEKNGDIFLKVVIKGIGRRSKNGDAAAEKCGARFGRPVCHAAVKSSCFFPLPLGVLRLPLFCFGPLNPSASSSDRAERLSLRFLRPGPSSRAVICRRGREEEKQLLAHPTEAWGDRCRHPVLTPCFVYFCFPTNFNCPRSAPSFPR